MSEVVTTSKSAELLTGTGFEACVDRYHLDKKLLNHNVKIITYGNFLWENTDATAFTFDCKRQKLVNKHRFTQEEMAWGELLTVLQVFDNLEHSNDYNGYAPYLQGFLQHVRELDQGIIDRLVDRFNQDSIDYHKRLGKYMVEYSAAGLNFFAMVQPKVYFRETCLCYKRRVSSRSRYTVYRGYHNRPGKFSSYIYGETYSTTYYTDCTYSVQPDSVGTLYVTQNEIGYISDYEQFNFPLHQLHSIQIVDGRVHIYKNARQTPFIMDIDDVNYFTSVITNLRYGYIPKAPILLKNVQLPSDYDDIALNDKELCLPQVADLHRTVIRKVDSNTFGNLGSLVFIAIAGWFLWVCCHYGWKIPFIVGLIFTAMILAAALVHGAES